MANSQKFSIFTAGEVNFESTWNLGRTVEKSSTISVQTDPLPAKVNKATSSQELKHIMVQTEPFFNTATLTRDDAGLANSMRVMAKIMEEELKKGNTKVFKF